MTTADENKAVGFIGLGNVGAKLAGSLLRNPGQIQPYVIWVNLLLRPCWKPGLNGQIAQRQWRHPVTF